MRPRSYAVVSLAAGCLFAGVCLAAEDPGWPRQYTGPQGTLITYQPQVDDWRDFHDLDFRMAFTVKPSGGKEAPGVAEITAHTDVNAAQNTVQLSDIKIKNINFPSQDPATAATDEALVRSFVPKTTTVSLQRIVACTPKKASAPPVAVDNTPPAIFVSQSPAVLLFVEGQPSLAPVQNTNIQYVANTRWPLFRDGSNSMYYLLVNDRWLSAQNVQGPWTPVTALPADMSAISSDAQWASLKNVIPPPANPNGPLPRVFYSSVPADIILFRGIPHFSGIPGAQLTYATNTDSNVFIYGPTQQYYYLTAGRWFSSNNLQGPWVYATPNLPPDFAKIPPSSPAGRVLAWVPGTPEAKDAVLKAQVPTTLDVKPNAASQVNVSYVGGAPEFKPIEGTSMTYAVNTPDKVINVDGTYYLCLQGVWFFSATPQGPWTTAGSVPQAIYTIPPSSPVYNVTYVTQTTNPNGDIEASHTAGYLGAFVAGAATGAIVASGTGYYYPPYAPALAAGAYMPYPATYGATPYYNDHTGAYGLSQSAYGPNGGSADRTASYNPYTGTMARTASVSTPYGSRAAGQAYNPYTGTYAQTKQGSAPGEQWGSSAVTRGDQTTYAQHYSNERGTAAAAESTRGGEAAGVSTAHGDTAAGKTANGDMYADKDGNVYRNTGGGWQKYGKGGWNSMPSDASKSAAQSADRSMENGRDRMGGDSGGLSSLRSEMDNRRRGDMGGDRFSRGGGGRRR